MGPVLKVRQHSASHSTVHSTVHSKRANFLEAWTPRERTCLIFFPLVARDSQLPSCAPFTPRRARLFLPFSTRTRSNGRQCPTPSRRSPGATSRPRLVLLAAPTFPTTSSRCRGLEAPFLLLSRSFSSIAFCSVALLLPLGSLYVLAEFVIRLWLLLTNCSGP
jgi:hypothetical protein